MEMDLETLNSVTKAIVNFVFRNGIVEDYHAAGKLSNMEMKMLTKQMVNRLGRLLYLYTTGQADKLKIMLMVYSSMNTHWDDIDLEGMDEALETINNLDLSSEDLRSLLSGSPFFKLNI